MDSDEEAAWLEEEKAIEEEKTAQVALLVEQEEAARKRARLEVDFPLYLQFCLFPNGNGKTLVWILSQDYPKQGKIRMQFG